MFEKILIKKRLRECREKKGFVRPYVVKKVGIGLNTLIGWESNICLPPLDKAGQLAELYGVSLDYIVGRTDNPEVNK